jgi:hypothetical protein
MILVVFLAIALQGSASAPLPEKLAVYYGWPIAVNGKWAVSTAAAEFDSYDYVVFGAGLEDPSHPEYSSTVSIIAATSAGVFGYVDATLSTATIEGKIDQWDAIGVVGIFCDQFGFDFGLTRSKQNDIVDYIHNAGLSAFVNAWEPDDVFKKKTGVDTVMGAGDWYLAESHHVLNGDWQSAADWEAKSDKMQSYKSQWGSSMACVTTTTSAAGFDQTKWDNAYYSVVVYGFDAAGWGEPNFSASDALLPWRDRPYVNGTELVGDLVKQAGGVFERATNAGVSLDATNHVVGDLIG